MSALMSFETKYITDSIIMYYQTSEIKPDSVLLPLEESTNPSCIFKVGNLYEKAFIEDLENGLILEYYNYRQNINEHFPNDIYIRLYFRANNLPDNKPLEFKDQKLTTFQTPTMCFGELWEDELKITPKDLYDMAKMIANKTGRNIEDISNEFLKMLYEKAENLDGSPRVLRINDEIGIVFANNEDGHINAFIELLSVMDNVFGANFLILYQTIHENANQRILKRTI